jgi:AcrR family transcriptional regulator
VADAILEAAAHVLATAGEHASMADVAVEAGVARATVYRYFPSRSHLLAELARQATRDAGDRLSAARIDEGASSEGIRRAIRALLEVGDRFVVVARERVRPDPDEQEERVGAPLRRLIERGQAAGEIRDDVPAAWLSEALTALAVSILDARPARGREDTVAVITSLFLDGIRRRASSVEAI